MTLLSLTDCCHLLSIDAKTLRRWLAQAHIPLQPHPGDARSTGITGEHLRLLATAHHRSLPAVPGELPALAPSGPAQEPFPLPPEFLALLQQLSTLPAQLAAVQQQLSELTERLVPPPATASPAHQGQPRVRSRLSVSAPARSRSAKASATPRTRPSAHVLALVEYVREGHYVLICPKRGLLPLEPDTPAWLAWLATVTSFRFVGKCGRMTVHRELHNVKRAVWRAHRKLRNHTYNRRLGKTQDLTIAALEQAAAALQAHLN